MDVGPVMLTEGVVVEFTTKLPVEPVKLRFEEHLAVTEAVEVGEFQ